MTLVKPGKIRCRFNANSVKTKLPFKNIALSSLKFCEKPRRILLNSC